LTETIVSAFAVGLVRRAAPTNVAEVMRAPSPTFRSRLRPLSIIDYERMSPAARARREFDEEAERQAWADEQRRKPLQKPKGRS
jgi:hypothetical protein